MNFLKSLSRLEWMIISIVLLVAIAMVVFTMGSDDRVELVNQPPETSTIASEADTGSTLLTDVKDEPLQEPIIEKVEEQSKVTKVAIDAETDQEGDEQTHQEMSNAAIEGAPEIDYSIAPATDLPPVAPEEDVPPYGVVDTQGPASGEAEIGQKLQEFDNINELVIEGESQTQLSQPNLESLPEVSPEDDVPPRPY